MEAAGFASVIKAYLDERPDSRRLVVAALSMSNRASRARLRSLGDSQADSEVAPAAPASTAGSRQHLRLRRGAGESSESPTPPQAETTDGRRHRRRGTSQSRSRRKRTATNRSESGDDHKHGNNNGAKDESLSASPVRKRPRRAAAVEAAKRLVTTKRSPTKTAKGKGGGRGGVDDGATLTSSSAGDESGGSDLETPSQRRVRRLSRYQIEVVDPGSDSGHEDFFVILLQESLSSSSGSGSPSVGCRGFIAPTKRRRNAGRRSSRPVGTTARKRSGKKRSGTSARIRRPVSHWRSCSSASSSPSSLLPLPDGSDRLDGRRGGKAKKRTSKKHKGTKKGGPSAGHARLVPLATTPAEAARQRRSFEAVSREKRRLRAALRKSGATPRRRVEAGDATDDVRTELLSIPKDLALAIRSALKPSARGLQREAGLVETAVRESGLSVDAGLVQSLLDWALRCGDFDGAARVVAALKSELLACDPLKVRPRWAPVAGVLAHPWDWFEAVSAEAACAFPVNPGRVADRHAGGSTDGGSGGGGGDLGNDAQFWDEYGRGGIGEVKADIAAGDAAEAARGAYFGRRAWARTKIKAEPGGMVFGRGHHQGEAGRLSERSRIGRVASIVLDYTVAVMEADAVYYADVGLATDSRSAINQVVHLAPNAGRAREALVRAVVRAFASDGAGGSEAGGSAAVAANQSVFLRLLTLLVDAAPAGEVRRSVARFLALQLLGHLSPAGLGMFVAAVDHAVIRSAIGCFFFFLERCRGSVWT